MDQVVRARGLERRYGDRTAVAGVDLDVSRGVIVGCIGPSGSGKTTTVRLLTGIERPSAGEVAVFGVRPSSFTPAHRRRIGYMPQLNVLYPHLSLEDNLQFVASLYGLPLRRQARLDEVLRFVELEEHRGRRLSDASGGMQRRLALAATLLHEPELLFLDEPTAGIDPVLRRRFWDHFGDLRQRGSTLFVTTQYVGEAAYCDEVAVLAEGRLLLTDTPEGLRRRALGGDVVDLVAAEAIPDEAVEGLSDLDYVAGAERIRTDGRGVRAVVHEAGAAIPALQGWLAERAVRLDSVQQYSPPFDDVFVELVQRAQRDA
jgi:ABC-2 type transport system ATP-binding protein